MPKRILGIVYLNENGALTLATQDYCRVFQAMGYESETIDLTQTADRGKLGELLQSGETIFCFGMQGVGSHLKLGEENLWTRIKTPFIALHFDNPCYNPLNHTGDDSPYVANLYHFESFLQIQRRYIGSRSPSGLLPFEIPLPVPEPQLPFAKRPIKFLYMKTGAPLEPMLEEFPKMPPILEEGAREILKQTENDPNLLICDVVRDLFIRSKFEHLVCKAQFWAVVQVLDLYIRRKRAIDFVEWLKFQEGAVIIGGGWDFIDRTGARAEFRPPIPMHQSFPLYEQTQFVCNASPYSSDMIHERVVAGLAMGSCVLSDTNSWWDKNFSDVPALTRLYWNRPLDDQLDIVRRPELAAEASLTGRAPALQHFWNRQNFERIISCAEQVRNNAPAAIAQMQQARA
jgi:hypothetical protein